MIKNNRNNEQIYGRNDMIMLDLNNKIYGSLGLADNYVMKTEEGTRLVLNNPKLGKFGDVLTEFNMYGMSSQNKTTGKNLLKYPYIEANKTSFGIKFTDNKDGSITISGTSAETAYYNLYSNIDGKRLTLASGTYKLVVKGRSKCNVSVNNGVNSAKNEGTFTITDGHNDVWCYIEVPKGLTVDETIYPMIQFASITDESYEPYTGGIPSPSPDYPQEIKSVVNPTIKVCGNNLLPPGLKYEGNVKCYIKKGTKVTLVTKDGFVSRGGNIKFFDDNNNIMWFGFDKGNKKQTVILTIDAYSFDFLIPDLKSENISLMIGDTGTYEPYKEQSIQLPITLNAIPVQSGGNVTIDGQQFVCDEVDLTRGVRVQRINRIKLNDLSWHHEITQINKNDSFISDVSASQDGTMRGDALCQYAVFNGVNYDAEMTEGSRCYVWMKTVTIQFKAGLGFNSLDVFLEWLKARPDVSIYYCLANPIETPFTDDEIAAFNAFTIYYPVTIIENNYNTWMKATYKSIESV